MTYTHISYSYRAGGRAEFHVNVCYTFPIILYMGMDVGVNFLPSASTSPHEAYHKCHEVLATIYVAHESNIEVPPFNVALSLILLPL